MSNEDPDPDTEQELREQLAAAKSEISDNEETIDSLESDLDEKDSTIDDLTETVDDKENAIETKNDRINQLKEDSVYTRRRFALAATGGNEAAAEAIVENENKSLEDIAGMVVEEEDLDEPEEEPEGEQLSAIERAEEQLAGNPEPRGGDTGNRDPSTSRGDLTEDEEADAEELARQVMSGTDVMTASQEQLSPREYVSEYKGADPAEFSSEQSLRSAIDNGGEQ